MGLTHPVNSKANVKKHTNQDVPFSSAAPVTSKYEDLSTASQTVISLPWSVDQNLLDSFFLFVDGKLLRQGASHDYVFTSIDVNGYSAQVTLNQALAAGLNILAYKLGYKKESEFGVDNRFLNTYEGLEQGFQGFVKTPTYLTPISGTPGAGQFYSSIIGRAVMFDFSQDLKPRMGVERISLYDIYPIQGEIGPNGERVWGAIGDALGQFRAVGHWSPVTLSSLRGLVFGPSANNTFMEITFYGTGLNILHASSGSGDTTTVEVDGVSIGSVSIPPTGSVSNVIFARSSAVNQVSNVVRNLSLGVHTVKITITASNNYYSGFEILNESSSVKVQPGISYASGKKLSLSAQHSFLYNASPVTGVRGGRVLVYQNSDGSIGKAFQAVDGTQANMNSANHANEEVVATHHFREFGAGRSDDFSLLGASTSTKGYVLNDGTTTLVGGSVEASVGGNLDRLHFAALNAEVLFTFVGTGLDIVQVDNNTTIDTYNVFIDRISIGTLTAVGTGNVPKIQKIVSGLPYGTHTLRIVRATTGQPSSSLMTFTVYQPKKPSLPSGATELADFNVMANFVFDTVTPAPGSNSMGTLRKMSLREMVYVSGTANIDLSSGSYDPGNTVATLGNGDYLEYNFFGTGIVARENGNGGQLTVMIDGQSNFTTTNPSPSFGAGWSSVPTVNFSGTGASFTSSTGAYVNGTNVMGQVAISGLNLGMHRIRITKTGGTSWQHSALDIITPIHSHKYSIQGAIQNTLPTGSCGISDNRKLTPVKDVLPAVKAWAQAAGVTSNPTTTSTVPVPVPDMSTVIKTSGGPLQIDYSFIGATNGIQEITLSIVVDSMFVGTNKRFQTTASGFELPMSDTFITQVAPGVHKVDVYWTVGGGTATAWNTYRNLSVKEL